jgi:hypothetical protein
VTPPRTRAGGTTKSSSASSKQATKSAGKSAGKSAAKTAGRTSKSGGKSAVTTAGAEPTKRDAAKSTSRRSASAPKAAARPRPGAAEVARHAAEQLARLIRKDAGEVTQLEHSDDGWSIHVEVLELRRVPDTMDMMSLYEVTTDDNGSLEGYRRLRRYVRGVPGEE